MDTLLEDTKTYYTNVSNQLEIIVKTYNLEILEVFKKDRLFTEGDVVSNKDSLTVIFGKPDIKTKIEDIFAKVYSEIPNNPLFNAKYFEQITQPSLKIIETNLTTYIKTKVQNNFSNSIQQIIQNLSTQQESLVQDIRKINLICEKTDGIIVGGGNVRVYNLTETGEETDTLTELNSDFKKFSENINKFYGVEGLDIINENLGIKLNPESGLGDFYMVIVQTFKNKKNEFRTSVLGEMLKDEKKYKKEIKAFDSSLDDLSKLYIKELEYEIKEYGKRKEKIKKEFIDKILENIYVKGKERKFTYTTVPSADDSTQKTKIKQLYATQNPNTDTSTFDGKIKFN